MTLDELKSIEPTGKKKEELKNDVTPETRIKAPVAKGRKNKAIELPWFLSIFVPDKTWSLDDLIEYKLKPSIRSGIHGLIVDMVDQWFDDDRGSRKRSSREYVSYSRYGDDRDRDRRRDREEERDRRHSKTEPAFCEMIFESKNDAYDVLDSLEDALHEYKIISMADAYVAADMNPVHTDYNYGWKDISRAYVRRDGNKYVLVMPKAQPID